MSSLRLERKLKRQSKLTLTAQLGKPPALEVRPAGRLLARYLEECAERAVSSRPVERFLPVLSCERLPHREARVACDPAFALLEVDRVPSAVGWPEAPEAGKRGIRKV